MKEIGLTNNSSNTSRLRLTQKHEYLLRQSIGNVFARRDNIDIVKHAESGVRMGPAAVRSDRFARATREISRNIALGRVGPTGGLVTIMSRSKYLFGGGTKVRSRYS